MKYDIIFALDVGGTYIKACVIENNNIIHETICEFDAYANQDKDTILNHFSNIIHTLSIKHTNRKDFVKNGSNPYKQKRIGIGFAFPGPFDYKKGISYISGLDKFESLYGVCIYDQLLERLQKTEMAKEAKDLTLLFENDARLFGLGASTMYPDERLICLTIGTGLGSVFINEGRIVEHDKNIPPNGYLFNQSYKGQSVDDRFSRRGILQAAASKGINDKNIDVKELAELAIKGNQNAIAVFTEFGSDLAQMLDPFVEKFRPNKIIIGGQIAKSFNLFDTGLKQRLQNTDAISLDNALHFTFLGITRLFYLLE